MYLQWGRHAIIDPRERQPIEIVDQNVERDKATQLLPERHVPFLQVGVSRHPHHRVSRLVVQVR